MSEIRNMNVEPHTLMKQASETAHLYMTEAVKKIDAMFSTGYAKAHPELIVGFMKAAAQDFDTSIHALRMQNLTEAITDLADAIEEPE